MKETALINSRGQKYLNSEGLLERVKDETKNQNRQAQEGKDGFTDCIGDDKTRLSNMQNATRTTRSNVLGDENIEHTTDEQNLE